MKKLLILLLLLVGAVTLVPSQAEARDRRHYRNYDNCNYGYSYRRPVYRSYYSRPVVYYSTPRYYAPRYYDYYDPAPVYYSRPRSSFSFTIAR